MCLCNSLPQKRKISSLFSVRSGKQKTFILKCRWMTGCWWLRNRLSRNSASGCKGDLNRIIWHFLKHLSGETSAQDNFPSQQGSTKQAHLRIGSMNFPAFGILEGFGAPLFIVFMLFKHLIVSSNKPRLSSQPQMLSFQNFPHVL